MAETLYAPTEAGQSLYKDRGSKFLGFAFPCKSLSEGEARLAELKAQYHDARHHCYAYRLGKRGEASFANDDGEPAHSAGDPILGAIRSEELTQVWVVVIRYFGGTKLGVRGLIEAYREAAQQALTNLPREEVIRQVFFAVDYAYDQTSDVNRILHPYHLREVEAVYTDRVRQVLALRKEHFAGLRSQLEAAQIECEILSEDD